MATLTMPARALKMLITQSPVGALVGKLPGVRAAYKNSVWRHPHFVKSYFGVYGSYAEAAAAAPTHWDVGWDNDKAFFSEWVQPSFYASVYWLSRVLWPGSVLVEFGGRYGGAFVEYTKREAFPHGAKWIVVDVPAVIKDAPGKAGVAAGSPLSFRTEFRSLPHIDIFFSAGSVQYLDLDVRALVAMITAARPKHVLLNNFALTSGPGFWSLQHLGAAMAPNHIFNDREFLGAFDAAGYRLVDRWDVAELNCQIPFEPHRYVKSFAGVFLERVD
jgi:putative methyltransferase (TIGR04325 family)